MVEVCGDRGSWDYVSQQGTDQEVIDFLKTQNLQSIALDRVAFRLRDAALYQQVIDVLRQRHAFDPTLWSYSLQHQDAAGVREYLLHRDDFVQQCGDWIDSPLLTIDPVERKTYQHLEYHPLVNARAHQIGQQRKILNDRFYEQYVQWLKLLSYQRNLDAESHLVTVYYLLLQDRVAEAIAHFSQIDASQLATRLQYDYCHAYLAMSQGDTSTARAVADRYDNYEVDRWRNAFALVDQHLDEIEHKGSFAIDKTQREQAQDALAAAEPSLDLEVRDKTLRIQYRNIEQVRVRYYLMDIELLFSRNPFVQQHQGQFGYIAPNSTEQVSTDGPAGTVAHDLPQELRNKNVLVEVEAAGQRVSKPYYSNALNVQVVESYGQVRVTLPDSTTPLSTVYCKVYARMNDGSAVFYKDGYTDLRGRFDYATLSTSMLESVDRFAILVMSDEHGAMVREAKPPQR